MVNLEGNELSLPSCKTLCSSLGETSNPSGLMSQLIRILSILPEIFRIETLHKHLLDILERVQ